MAKDVNNHKHDWELVSESGNNEQIIHYKMGCKYCGKVENITSMTVTKKWGKRYELSK